MLSLFGAKPDVRPTIRLTNFSTRRLHHGRVYSIMAMPREWERGFETVFELTPHVTSLQAVRAGTMDMEEYRARFEADLSRRDLRPGHLSHVADGDTCCCSCARDAARAWRCHRSWAAPFLHAAGWRVLLDGALFTPEEEK